MHIKKIQDEYFADNVLFTSKKKASKFSYDSIINEFGNLKKTISDEHNHNNV